ncbi:MAG: hypothetical protein V2A65_07640 [Candidatus Omnitrophota bacterium]
MKIKLILAILLGILLVFPALSFATAEEDEGRVICSEPNISPAGTKIIFACNVAYGNIDIWTINVDGTGLRKFAVIGREPIFSPDGKIAYLGSNENVWIMEPDGSGQNKLDEWPFWYSTCEWFSPDGTKSAFYGEGGLWIENRDGTERKQLTTGNYEDWDPCWFPDSTHIIFSSNRGYQPPEPAGEIWRIWRIKADGTGLTQITENEFFDPVYTPDGTKIVAVGEDGQIWIMDSNGSNQQKVTNFPLTIVKSTTPITFDPDKWNIAWLDEKEGEGYTNCYIGKIEGDISIGVEGYEVDRIDENSLVMTVQVPVVETYELSPEGPSQVLNQHPGFTGKVLKVKFNKFKAMENLKRNQGGLEAGKTYEVLIRGETQDGQNFSGTATIQIIGGKKQ